MPAQHKRQYHKPAKIKPKALWIRYTLKHPRIKSLIPEHFENVQRQVIQAGATGYNTTPLLESMGIPTKRFLAILDGAMPTLGEVVGYATYFDIEISSLYTVLPFKQKKQAA